MADFQSMLGIGERTLGINDQIMGSLEYWKCSKDCYGGPNDDGIWRKSAENHHRVYERNGLCTSCAENRPNITAIL